MSRCFIENADNLVWLCENSANTNYADGKGYNLIFADAPYNTGVIQKRDRTDGTVDHAYLDRYGDNYKEFLYPRLQAFHKALLPNGSLMLKLDWHEVHYAKVWLDEIFGSRECFKNEIIWAYDYGARQKNVWPRKHDTILWYTKDPNNYTFNYDSIDRLPYMAEGRQTAERAELGKTPTDVWWQTIVPTQGREKTGYNSQKPHQILDRIIRVHTKKDDWVLDPFAGSGTTGESCLKLDRNCVMLDINPAAVAVMRKRFSIVQQEFL